MADRTLSIADARHLGKLVDAVDRRAHVGWSTESFDTLSGTLRAFTDKVGMFLPTGIDVRDMHVWITMDEGFEMFPPVAEIVAQMADSMFALDYES